MRQWRPFRIRRCGCRRDIIVRRIPVVVGAITFSLAATAALVAASPGVSGAARSARAIYQSAIAYAGTQDVHYVSLATQGGATLRVAGNTAPTSGTQSLTVTSGATTEALTATLVGNTGYVRGNAAALTSILGLTAEQSAREANVWLSFPTGNQALDQLTSGLRNRDVATELELSGPYSLGPTKTIDGHATQGVTGYTSDSSNKKIPTTLYVETGGPPRPLQEVSDPGHSTTDIDGTVTLSHWGQTTRVARPTHTISLLSLLPAG
jgi:hypothetical protein